MSVNHDIADAIIAVTIRTPSTPAEALPYYKSIRDWLDAEISTLEKDMAKSERPHETLARIARETRNAKETAMSVTLSEEQIQEIISRG